MIVKMKKVTLLCLEQDKTIVLNKLRDLGVMQIEYAKTPESTDVTQLTATLSSAERALQILAMEEGKDAAKIDCSGMTGEQAAQRILELSNGRTDLEKQLHALERDRDELLPWGEFDSKTLDALRAKGLHPYLCNLRKADFEALDLPESIMINEISRSKTDVFFLAVGTEDFAPEYAVTLPAGPLSAIEAQIAAVQKQIADSGAEILALKTAADQVKAYAETVAEKLEFSSVRDGMEDAGKVAYIFGYVPVTETEKLQKCAEENGMALLIEDPAEDDERVPTYIVKPKFLNIMDPLFDFIGVTPGYRENDVNMFFLIFFPIFFGMIIGDAGYGMIFIAITLLCMFTMWKKKPALHLPLSLFMLLSVVTVIWGWLNGSWCGIPRTVLPGFMQGCDFIADPQKSHAAIRFADWAGLINSEMTGDAINNAMGDFKNKFIQFLCFAIAGVHLPCARLFRFFDDIRGTWRAIGHLGWAMLLAANAILAVNLIVFTSILTVHPDLKTAMIAMYAIGVVLIAATVAPKDALNLPFSLVGSFVDVLSYIRLFAVGLAGAFISEKFNGMGADLMHSMPDALQVLGAILLILVAVIGNLLNIALGFLSVLVHAIRLNTLEFSNHIEMQWAGFKFRPFKKDNK